jgi:hypothetical protein
VDDITLDRALIFGILQQGREGFFRVRDLGLRSEHVQDEDQAVFELCETSIRKNSRLPTLIEIKAATDVDIILPSDPFDPDLFGRKVAERALMNKLKDGLGPITREVLVDPTEARKKIAELVKETSWSLGSVASYTDPSIADAIFDSYEQAKSRKGGLLGYSSPWPNVDCHSMGLQPGELTVVLAKRKTGKTWVLLKWFVHILRNDLKPGESILIASMEMPAVQMYRRMAAIDLHLDYANFRAGRLTVEEEKRLKEWVERMRDGDDSWPTVHVAGADVIRSVGDICDKVAELDSKLVGLDGLYILGRDSKKGMWERTIDNVSELKLDLCAGMNIGCLATSQFRGGKNKNELNADADDAAYAKAIGDWADAMRGLFMNPAYEKNKKRVFRAMESREFQGVDLVINFDLDTMNFKEDHVITGEKDEEKTPFDDDKKDDTTEDVPTVLTGKPELDATEPPEEIEY